jgi:hypothetical protein
MSGYAAVSTSATGRQIAWTDQLHEHFTALHEHFTARGTGRAPARPRSSALNSLAR